MKSNDINVKASKSINQAAEQTKRIHLHNVTYVTYVTDLSSADIEYLIPEMLKMPTQTLCLKVINQIGKYKRIKIIYDDFQLSTEIQ